MRYQPVSDRYLVIEQKGLRVLLTGLFIAFLMGLTFKAIFSPQRIKYEIEKGIADSNQKNLTVKIEKAYLSLQKEWIPRLAIVVENLDLQSSDPCLYNAVVKVDILTIPVTLQSIIDRSLSLKKVEMEKLRAHFQMSQQTCAGTTGSTSLQASNLANSNQENASPTKPDVNIAMPEGTVVPHAPPIHVLPLNSRTAQAPSAKVSNDAGFVAKAAPLVQTMSIESGALEEVILQDGQFYFDTFPSFYVQLKKVHAYIKSAPVKQTLVEGNIELIPISNHRLQAWQTRFSLEQKADDLTAKVFGHWREGNINLGLNFNSKANTVAIEGQLNQVPLAQVFVLGQIVGEMKEVPSARQSWVSLEFKGQQTPDDQKSFQIKNMQVEGDFGELKVPLLMGAKQHNENWKWDPIKIQIESVIIDKFIALFDWPHPSPALASLGVFDGQISLEGSHLKSLEGQVKGLEFIFSNKGKRDIQVVEKFTLDLKDSGDRYKYSIQDMFLRDGQFLGKIEGDWLQNLSRTEMVLNVDQLKFNPQIESLMTNHGNLSPVQGKVNLIWKQGDSPQIQGQLKIEKGQVEKIDFEKLKWDFDTHKDESLFKIHLQTARLNDEALGFEELAEILKSAEDQLDVRNLSLVARKKSEGLTWDDFQAQFPVEKIKITSKGQWDQDGKLAGQVQFFKLNSSKSIRELTVSGTRDQPEWNESIPR